MPRTCASNDKKKMPIAVREERADKHTSRPKFKEKKRKPRRGGELVVTSMINDHIGGYTLKTCFLFSRLQLLCVYFSFFVKCTEVRKKYCNKTGILTIVSTFKCKEKMR